MASREERPPLAAVRARTVAWVGVAALAAACGGEGGASRAFLSIGTAGTGGIYYPLGGAMASRMSVADSTRRYTAEVTGGSVENLNRVARGEMDLGFTMATNAYLAYHGGPDHPVPLTNLRLVAPLYPNLVHVLVGRGVNVTGIDQLRGRRISVGSPGSGTEQVSQQVLEAHGLSYEDIDARFLSFRESSDALRDGAIDAAIIAAGYPASAVLEVATAGAASLLPMDEARVSALSERYSYYSPATIPSGAYPGLNRDVPTIAVMNWIVGSEALDSSVVALVLNTIAADRRELEQVHSIAAQIDLDALGRRPPIPLHSAAAAWYAARP